MGVFIVVLLKENRESISAELLLKSQPYHLAVVTFLLWCTNIS